MSTLRAVIRTEIRLAWRRPTFWVVQLLWVLPLLLTLGSNLGISTPRPGAPYVSEQLVTSLMIWLVLLPLIVAPALTRDLGVTGETLWATPLDTLTHLLGVMVGLLVALIPAIMLQLAAQTLVGLVVIGSPAWLFWRYGPPLLLASTIAATSVAVLLALLLRRTLLLLLVWVALWAGVFQLNLGILDRLDVVGLQSLANLFFYSLQLSPSLGLGLSQPLVQALVLWFVGLGVLVALLAVGMSLLADSRRALRRGFPLLLWGVLALLLAGGGLLLHTGAVRAQAISSSPTDIQAGLWQVKAHTLEVEVDTRTDSLAGTSTLYLAPSTVAGVVDEKEVVLRLNPGLRLTAAQDDSGRELSWEQQGDSVVVALAGPVASPLILHLRWQGMLYLPYNDYAERFGFSFPSYDTPQTINAMLAGGVGYLLRDGDWYPWPWAEGPGIQQADENHITLRVIGGEALSAHPLVDSIGSWEGDLPAVLLVFPPSGSITVSGRILHFGTLGGSENAFILRLQEIARLLPTVAAAVGAEQAPTHIVALPYLQRVIWSGDLLLVPEGTGLVPDNLRRLLFAPRSQVSGTAQIEERALMSVLARAWLADQTQPPAWWARVRAGQDGVVAVTGIPGQEGVVELDPSTATTSTTVTRERWIRVPDPPENYLPPPITGQSQPAPETSAPQDLRTMGDVPLRPNDYLDLLALWLSLELASPEVREADLAVLLAPPNQSQTSAKFEPFLLRSLPIDFPVSQAQKAALVRALHEWTEEIGRDEALRLFGEVMREQGGLFDLEQLLAELEQRSNVAIDYGNVEASSPLGNLQLPVIQLPVIRRVNDADRYTGSGEDVPGGCAGPT